MLEPMTKTNKKAIIAWGLWDLGSAAFNAVLVTFVFSVYLIESVGVDIDSGISAASWYGIAIGLAGACIAALAPVIGQRADARGARRRSVRLWTITTVVLMLCLFGIRNDDPTYFWFGIILMALGSITFELAEVSYFAMLNQISTKENVGRISGFGWGLGYLGGIVLLLLCNFGFITGDGGLFNLSTEGGFHIRMVAVLAAVWFLLFALPVMVAVPEIPPNPEAETRSLWGAYKALFRSLKELWRTDRSHVIFLIASAVFRDGLAGVFTFGAILAVSVYGLTPSQVLLFGVSANVISALTSFIGGWVDDKVGPKPVIMVSLLAMVTTSGILFVVEGPTNFWIYGLILCMWVGPAQASSRSFLARITHEGLEGQMFGLYATTGRAVSWLAPGAFTLSVILLGNDRGGILGLALVLLIGALILGCVRQPHEPHHAAH